MSANKMTKELENISARDTSISPDIPLGKAALVVAHPGHELKVYGWFDRVHPKTFVLTDGSGRTGSPRLDLTTKNLESVRAKAGGIYGRFTDQKIYTAFLDQSHGFFIDLAQELSEDLVKENVEYVVGDALEGYNPTHDICRVLINTAVEVASQKLGRRIMNYSFLLAGQPHFCPSKFVSHSICMKLTEDTFQRKVSAARAYDRLEKEVKSAIEESGLDAFRAEYLHCIDEPGAEMRSLENPPYYERYGEKQVTAGYYSKILRYRQHFLPVAEAIWRELVKL